MSRQRRSALSAAILSALGGSAAALVGPSCGGEVLVTGSGGASSSSATSAETSATTGGGHGGSGPSVVAVTVGGMTTTTGAGGACADALLEYPAPPPVPVDACTEQESPYGPYEGSFKTCFLMPADGDCDAAYDADCILDTYSCGLNQKGDTYCGPYIDEGACCYVVLGHCAVGRPFVVDGLARTATVERRDDWRARIAVEVEQLSDEARAVLAETWTREALAEHASVASFSRFLLQLLALGAPAELVRAAQRAVDDEIRHAEIAFALASALAGQPLGPGALDLRDAFSTPELAAVAVEVASEGAIAETVSAAIVAASRDAARDPALKSLLATIAAEEQEHAVLAWRFLDWALAAGGPVVAAAIERVLSRPADHVGIGPVVERAQPSSELRAFGYLAPDERRDIARRTLEEVVHPAAAALLRNHTARRVLPS